jgi:hypothetical protein
MNEQVGASVRARALRAIGVALSCVWCSSLASAQPGADPTPALRVRGGAGCVTTPALRTRIAGYLSPGEIAGGLAIEVDLSRQPAGFRVLRGGALIAERRFEWLPTRCAERRDAIALAIAVAIEHSVAPVDVVPDSDSAPLATAAEGTETPASALDAPPSPPRRAAAQAPEAPPAAAEGDDAPADVDARAAEPSQEPAPGAAADRQGPAAQRPSERFMLRAGGLYLVDALPTPAAALTFGAEYAVLPELRVGLAGLVSARVELAFEGGRVENQLFGGELVGCVNTPFLSMILLGCTGTTAAYVHARGFDYTIEQQDGMVWFAVLLRGAIELPATSTLAFRVVADARVNLLRPELSLERPGSSPLTHAVSPLGGSIGADLIVRLD